MPMKTLIETVSKVPLPASTKQVIVEVMASDEEGEDVEARYAYPRTVEREF